MMPCSFSTPVFRPLAAAVGLLLLTSGTSFAEPPSAPQADPSEQTEAGEAGAADGQAIPPAIVEGAKEHLTAAQRGNFDALSNAERLALLDREEKDLSDDERAVVEALNKAAFESQLNYQSGDIVVGDGLATLHLGQEFRYLDDQNAQKLLVDGWGNPPGGTTLGMIVPQGVSPLHTENGWGVIVTFAEDGYVEDDDAEDIDYDELLTEMQEDTRSENEGRKAAGYGTIELVGWAEPPRYDKEANRLYWAKHLEFEGSTGGTLNYAIRVLGRKGVLELNAVATMSQLGAIKKEMAAVLPRAEFNEGNRYADFDPDIDEVAAYGIGGLIAGKVLAKAGIFAGLFKLLIVAKKFLLFGLLALGGLAAKFFRRGGGSEST